MTYKLELFLVIKKKKKKKTHKYKIIQKLYFFFMVYLYWTPRFFYTKLTYLTQKLKNLD